MITEKTGILMLSITVLVTSGFVLNQAFAQADPNFDLQCLAAGGTPITDINDPRFGQCIFETVGGESLSVDTTALFVSGVGVNAAWLLPMIAGVAGTGLYLIKFRTNKE